VQVLTITLATGTDNDECTEFWDGQIAEQKFKQKVDWTAQDVKPNEDDVSVKKPVEHRKHISAGN